MGLRLIVDEVIINDDVIKELYLGKFMEDNGNRFVVYFMVVDFYKYVRRLIIEIMCIDGVLSNVYNVYVYCFVSFDGII